MADQYEVPEPMVTVFVAAASVAADECSRVLRQPRGRARSTKSRGLAADRMRSGTSANALGADVCCEALC